MASISVPAALAAAGTAVSAVGAGVSVAGSIKQGQAASDAAAYNAQVAKQNQTIATGDAVHVAQAGEAQVGQQQQKTRAQVGGIIANEAAAGVDVNSGSALDVRSSAASLGELDALSVRSNAAQQAFQYQTQGTSFADQSNLDTAEAANAMPAAEIGATGTLLGSAGSSADNYARYLSQNSPINTGDGSTGAIGGNYGLGIAG